MRCHRPTIFWGAIHTYVARSRNGRKKGIDMFWFGFVVGVVATFTFLLTEHLMGLRVEPASVQTH
jgi:hypothetical protein